MSSPVARFVVVVLTLTLGVFLAVSCGGSQTCDPQKLECPSGQVCCAMTGTCVAKKTCTSDTDCGTGFKCWSGTCEVNCLAYGSASDLRCQTDFKCEEASGLCKSSLSLACDYTADGEAVCNGTCAATKVCVASVKCASDAECGNYSCTGGKCKAACVSNADCGDKHACDLSKGTCGAP